MKKKSIRRFMVGASLTEAILLAIVLVCGIGVDHPKELITCLAFAEIGFLISVGVFLTLLYKLLELTILED